MSQFTLEGIDIDPVYKRSKDPHSGVVESSADMREKLAAEGKPVIVAFSRGKDSVCAAISLMEAGIDVIPVHMWRVPGLKFEEESLKYFEDFFQKKIFNLPHRDFWYYLANGVSLAPWQRAIVEAADIQEISHNGFWSLFKESLDLDDDTWVCDGIRAADSPMRRLSIIKNSPWQDSLVKEGDEVYKRRYARVVWDWKIKDIRRCIEINNVKLPVDYDLFGRTFDGLDYRFIEPLRRELPEDFETIQSWFPAIDLEFMRYEGLK